MTCTGSRFYRRVQVSEIHPAANALESLADFETSQTESFIDFETSNRGC